jgi:transcriptional regulator with XRE-family HTH domain
MKAVKLITYLKKKGLKGNSLADVLGVTRATISHMESGKTQKLDHAFIEKAAQYLNKKPSEVMSELEE